MPKSVCANGRGKERDRQFPVIREPPCRATGKRDEGTHLDKVELDLLLGEARPVVLSGLLLLEHQAQVLSGKSPLDLLDLGEQVQVKLVRLGLNLERGGGRRRDGGVSGEGDVGGGEGEGVRGVELGDGDGEEDDVLLGFVLAVEKGVLSEGPAACEAWVDDECGSKCWD